MVLSKRKLIVNYLIVFKIDNIIVEVVSKNFFFLLEGFWKIINCIYYICDGDVEFVVMVSYYVWVIR